MEYLHLLKEQNISDWLEKAINSRKPNNEELIDIKAILLNHYQNYEGTIRNTSTPPIATNLANKKTLLKDFYESPPAKLKILIAKRRNDHNLYECPYCGNPKSPDTIDHFMPKENWPEFSIFPDNMIPQCRECAPIKSTKYYCQTQKSSIFIHPIFCNTLSEIEFNITVLFDNTVKKIDFNITLKKPRHLSNSDSNRVAMHFRELNLNERVRNYCHREYLKWTNSLKKTNFDICIALQQRINEKHINDQFKNWKTSLYHGMLNNADLIKHMKSINPPP